MTLKFKGFSPSLVTPAPIPTPRVLKPGRDTDALVADQIRKNEASHLIVDSILEPKLQPDVRTTAPESDSETADIQAALDEQMHDSNKKLSRLISDDFPFDESQLAAIEGLVKTTAGCLTGAAGTGKTTVTKKLVDRLLTTVTNEVDMATYFRKPKTDSDGQVIDQPEAKYVPSVCVCTFTGKASQMVKKNFPIDWHGNIMTIHRMLAYAPEYYEDWDSESGELKNKMRFVPQYTAMNKMPWDIILMDESGMTSVDLWEEIRLAMKPGCRIYMIGDINQLPPVHGRSIFGFALSKWPAFELTTIHRQAGVNNSIVDNAWLILQGKTPITDGPIGLNLVDKEAVVSTLNYMVTNKDWKSLLLRVPDEPAQASRRIRQVLKILQGKFYDPIRDTVITAINGHDGSNGRVLGQLPMNMELSIALNQNPDRYIIDGGRERKNFAVGDKVMATVNDHEAGITNGMTGIIESIAEHAGYTGERARFGRVEDVADYLNDVEHDEVEFSLDDVAESMAAQHEAKGESKNKGPASHIITVQFGEGEYAITVPFSTLATVSSLMQAYVVTGHKMQGGEAPHVMTICHHVHKQMLYREWLYTCWTRASEKSVLLYTAYGLRQALNKQRIKGKTLQEKVESFQKVQRVHEIAGIQKFQLPDSENVETGEIRTNNALVRIGRDQTESGLPTLSMDTALLQKLNKAIERPAMAPPTPPTPEPEIIERVVYRDRIVILEREPIDGGDLSQDADIIDAEYEEVPDTKSIEREEKIQKFLEQQDQIMTPPARTTPLISHWANAAAMQSDGELLESYDWGLEWKPDPHIRHEILTPKVEEKPKPKFLFKGKSS